MNEPSDASLKQCAGECQQFLPATADFFHRNKNREDGLQTLCKVCMKAYKKQHYQTHQEQIKEKHKAYRETHQEQVKERKKRYAEVHKEQIQDYRKQYYKEHKEYWGEKGKQRYQVHGERIRARVKRYRETHKGLISTRRKARWQANREQIAERRRYHYATHREYYRAQKKRDHKKHREQRLEGIKRYQQGTHREQYLERKRQYGRTERGRLGYRVHWHKRRAQKRAAGGSYTPQQLQEQITRQKSRCYYCKAKLGKIRHVDHVVPLSKGGSNDISNIVIACPTCNMRKGAKLPHEWPEGNRLL